MDVPNAALPPVTEARWTRLGERCYQVGESPFWHGREQTLYWVDIDGRLICRANGYTGETQHWDMPETPGCIAPHANGGLLVALRNGVYRAPRWGGELTLLRRWDFDAGTTRFNDGKCDPLGRLWLGTLYEPRNRPDAALYACEADGAGGLTVVTQASGAVISNGLDWSPDGRTVYWADTPSHAVRAWDWDAGTNHLSRPRVFVVFAPKPADWAPGCGLPYGGRPDGAAMDAEGHYWVAMMDGGCLHRIAPDGRIVLTLRTPMATPTMPCFGGDDLRTLYLTSLARDGGSDPAAGGVFHTRVPVPGLPVRTFRES